MAGPRRDNSKARDSEADRRIHGRGGGGRGTCNSVRPLRIILFRYRKISTTEGSCSSSGLLPSNNPFLPLRICKKLAQEQYGVGTCGEAQANTASQAWRENSTRPAHRRQRTRKIRTNEQLRSGITTTEPLKRHGAPKKEQARPSRSESSCRTNHRPHPQPFERKSQLSSWEHVTFRAEPANLPDRTPTFRTGTI